MIPIAITGWGAVSPAGWGLAAARDAMAKGEPLAATKLPRPGRGELNVLRVPPPSPRPAFLAHPRLRRSSAVTQFTVAAALEALGPDPGDTSDLGILVCVFSGCVSYSRRFYEETLRDPGTASPLVFPETVFNAPASHLAAYLGSTAINYTLVGDSGTCLTALATAAHWLLEGRVERCLLIGAEETDWLSANAIRLFDRGKLVSEGAGALLLEREQASVRLDAITEEHLYAKAGKAAALRRMREELGAPRPGTLLCDGASPEGKISRAERELWRDWNGPRLSPRHILGEGLMAAAGWQCALAADALANAAASEAFISIAGFHQHALGARFSSALPTH